MSNNINEKFETSLGLSGFSNINKAGQFGDYSLDIFLEKNEATNNLVETLTNLHTTFVESQENVSTVNPLKITGVKEKDPDQFQGQDLFVFRLTKPATSRDGRELAAPRVYDASGAEVSLSSSLPIGSSVRASFNAVGYKTKGGSAGIKLYLNGLQIAKMGEKKSAFTAIDGDFIGVGTNTSDITLD